MPKNIKIISILTFSILTLHSQVHAYDISKILNNPKSEEIFNFNADQSKVKYATLAENTSQVKEYGEFNPDYKAETLEEFLQEHPHVEIASNEFSRFFDEKPLSRKGRCLSRAYQNYLNLINANNEEKRIARLIQQYSSKRVNRSTLALPGVKECHDNLRRCRATDNKLDNYHFKTTASKKLLFYNRPEILASTLEGKLGTNSFEKSGIKSVMESNFTSNYYFNKEENVPVPNVSPMTVNFFPRVMHTNMTKYFYDPNKSTKAANKGDVLLGESYLFGTTTSKVYKVKGFRETSPLYHNELKQIRMGNQSGMEHNASSLYSEQAIDKFIPSMINSSQNSNKESKIEENIINCENNEEQLVAKAVSENNFNKITDSLATAKQYVPNQSFESKLVLTTTLGNFIAADDSLRKTMSENDKSDLGYVYGSKEKTQSKNQQEAVFMSEKDYKLYVQDHRKLDTSKNLNEKGNNTFKKHQNIDKRDYNFNPERPGLEKLNFSSNITDAIHSTHGICYKPVTETVLMKNSLNKKLLAVSKRLASEEKGIQESSNLLNNFYEDYDYYFIIGDNNTDESPFQNDYRAMNARTEKSSVNKFNSNNETASYKLENTTDLTHNPKNLQLSRQNTNSLANNTTHNVSNLTPNIIHKFFPNVGNREKLYLQDGKNYILNLFRRKGNQSMSPTTTQTQIRNFFFRKRSVFQGNDKSVNGLAERNGKQLNKRTLLRDSTLKTNDGHDSDNINNIFEISQKVERPKRRSRAVNKRFSLRFLPHSKHLRRSIVNAEADDYNIKFQTLQKDLLELQKAISSPKAARPSRNEEKNLTLQIRVIVDVVNNSLGSTENSEDEQLKKRDTKLFEKKGNHAKIDVIPMPLEHESPLVGEKKGNDVWRNKRVDTAVNESQKNNLHINEGQKSSESDFSDDIIRNITYLLDNLLENYKLQNGDGKKNIFEHSFKTNPEYIEDQKLKHSFVHLRKSPSSNLKTCKPMMAGDYHSSTLLGGSKKQELKGVTQALNNNLLMEINKLLPSEIFTLLNIRNRRATNEKQSQKKIKDYNKKIFRNEISALYNIVENIKNKLVFKKVIDSTENEDNLSNEVDSYQSVGTTSEIPLEDSSLIKKKNCSKVTKYSLSENDARVDEILETIGNIGKELKQIDSKEKLLRGILDPEMKNHKLANKNRNKLKINRKKNHITISCLKSNKVDSVEPTRNKKIKKYIKETEAKKKKHDKTELPPCCENTTVDEGNHLSIEWCCAVEDFRSSLVTNSSSVSSVKSTTELSSESSETKQTEEYSNSSTETTKQEEENNSTQKSKKGDQITSSTEATSQVKKSTTSSIQTTTEVDESSSSTQTSQDEETTALSTQSTKKHLKKRNHNHSHVYKKHSRNKGNLLLEKYTPQSVEESFQ